MKYKFNNIAGILLMLTFLAGCKQEETREYPNILLIFTDQQNANMLSATGNTMLKTPHMDRLAQNGMMFSQAYCSSPVCGPSRSSLITGYMPHNTGVVWNGDSPKAEIMERNIGFLLRDIGYNTIWAGKWHLPDSYPQRVDSKIRETPGFEMLPFYDSTDNMWAFGFDTDGPLSDAVEDFLMNYTDEKPFFLAVSYHNPHDICFYPRKEGWFSENDSMLEIKNWGVEHQLPDMLGTHPDSLDKLPPLPENHHIGTGEPSFVHDKRIHPHRYGAETHMSFHFTEKEWRGYLNAYCRLTEMVDVEVGRIINCMEEYGLDENTIVVFTSDHGDGAAAHKWSAKNNLYKESAMIPFIISWPGKIEANQRNDTCLVSIADVVPTLLDLIGVESNHHMDGKSLKPCLLGTTETMRDYIVVELADDRYSPERKGRLLRTRNYSYCIYSNGEEQLYDIVNDPMEMNNLAGKETHQQIIENHRELLNEWMEETADPFVLEPAS